MANVNTKPKRRWTKILLVVSLGLNLLIAGLAVGSHFAPHKYGGGFHAGIGMRMLVGSLPEDHRTALRSNFRENRGKMREKGENMRRSLDDIVTAIAAQPFDVDALGVAFDAQTNRSTMVAAQAQKAFISIVSQMDDAERQAYVDTINERKEHFGKRRKKRD